MDIFDIELYYKYIWYWNYLIDIFDIDTKLLTFSNPIPNMQTCIKNITIIRGCISDILGTMLNYIRQPYLFYQH